MSLRSSSTLEFGTSTHCVSRNERCIDASYLIQLGCQIDPGLTWVFVKSLNLQKGPGFRTFLSFIINSFDEQFSSRKNFWLPLRKESFTRSERMSGRSSEESRR